MRAAILTRIGKPPQPGQLPDPSEGDGEVVVEVLAAPLNPIDVAVGTGRFYGGHPELPYVPGCEAVGRRRDDGTLVWVFGAGLGLSRDGGMAELVAAPEEVLCAVPEGADAALAAALGIAGLAGWIPVARRAPVRAGETVLVLGATGTAGLVALQAARLLGAGRIVAAGRDAAGLERAARLGADATVRIDGDFAEALAEACGEGGPTLVVDPLWGEPLATAVAVAAPGARIVNLGQSAGAEATLTSAAVRGKQLELLGHSNFAVPREALQREYRRLVEHAIAGDIQLEIDRVSLADVAGAWRRQADGAGRKLVVVR